MVNAGAIQTMEPSLKEMSGDTETFDDRERGMYRWV